ncbi:MAG TPA: MoaD/ThiS family protein [Flavobacteriales bacterium]|nr:MoaD/ThiS family protein [Flavobacteriales bacterium]
MNVLLFGLIAEKAGTDQVQVVVTSVRELRMALEQRIPELSVLSHAIAVDRIIVHQDMPLTGNEEIAVLPPFAGG